MQEQLTTKKKILYCALDLFSQRGYEGVSMRDIAAEVTIKGASLYNHFKSKQDIFESILDEMNDRYEKSILEMQAPLGTADEVADVYSLFSEEKLKYLVCGMFHYFLNDEYVSKFRKILTLEQFKNVKVGATYEDIYFKGALEYQTKLFSNLIQLGNFIKCDPEIMALQFYAPIYLLICQYDHYPEREEEAYVLLKKHVEQFMKSYLLK
jgi:hypothetical protein